MCSETLLIVVAPSILSEGRNFFMCVSLVFCRVGYKYIFLFTDILIFFHLTFVSGLLTRL